MFFTQLDVSKLNVEDGIIFCPLFVFVGVGFTQ